METDGLAVSNYKDSWQAGRFRHYCWRSEGRCVGKWAKKGWTGEASGRIWDL